MLLKCGWCEKEFNKENSEYNRRIKKKADTKFFCCQSCATSRSNTGRGGLIQRTGRNKCIRKSNDLSPFRYFLRKSKCRGKESNLDLEYLKELWFEQDGVCVISGIKMFLPSTGREWERDFGNPWKPSLDRIDSSKGYIKGNVQFVCLIANLSKYSWSSEVVIE